MTGSPPEGRTHALRLSERSEETQKASALHRRDSSYRRKDRNTLCVFPNEVRKPKKQVRFTVEIPPTVGRSGHRRKETMKQ
jgi:hypothetical protein